MGVIGDDKVIEHLLESTNDNDSGVRIEVAIALGNLQAPEAVDYLLKDLRDEHGNVRVEAVVALGKIGSAAILPLRSAMNTHFYGGRNAVRETTELIERG